MSQQTHRRRSGDYRTVLPVTLQQANGSGVLTVVDLTGLTVSFKLINAATSLVAIVNTSTGVTVVTASDGAVNYDFSATLPAGVYWATFTVTQSGETDAFPVATKGLKVIVDGDTQTGEEAFDLAVSAA